MAVIRQLKFMAVILCVSAAIAYLSISIFEKSSHPFLSKFTDDFTTLDVGDSTSGTEQKVQSRRTLPTTPQQTRSTRTQPSPWVTVGGVGIVTRGAFVDLAQSNEVRILANKHCLEKTPVKCVFRGAFFNKYAITATSYDNINSAFDNGCNENKYEAFYINCPLPELPGLMALFRPTELSLISDLVSLSMPPLPINYVPKMRNSFGVCVSPLFDWEDEYRLALFIEYYIYQGVDHFMIYNFSSSNSVREMLGEYAKRGLVTVVQWTSMPTPSKTSHNPNSHVHYHAQILSMNDCLWRLRGRMKYAAMIDIDELIVIFNQDRFPTVLDLLEAHDGENAGGFMFQSSFVYTKWPFDNANWPPDDSAKLFDFSKINVFRNREIFEPTVRSKVIVKPTRVEKQTVHLAWKYGKSYECQLIPPTTAMIYHMRSMSEKDIRVLTDNVLKDVLGRIFRFPSKQWATIASGLSAQTI